jgi:CheY-like chemotaxis protein
MPGTHLLLVDDSPEVHALVAHLCKRATLQLDWCPGVEAAWEFLQRSQPDLVLLDVQMPQLSGIELCRRIRAHQGQLRSLPIALFTHWGLPDDVLAGLEAGVDYVVSKDLLSNPANWQCRVTEIFRHSTGLRDTRSVSYIAGRIERSLMPPQNWTSIINQGLNHAVVRRIGVDIARLLVRRAVRQACSGYPDCFDAAAESVAASEPFPPDWTALIRRPLAAFHLADALMDQMDCLLGGLEGSTFRATLGPLLSGCDKSQTLT